MGLVLITGGVRAGKSTFAEQLALHRGGNYGVCFVATAEPQDEEMRERIAAHQRGRPSGWKTIEIPLQVAQRLESLMGSTVILLDCLTLLVSNILLSFPEESSEETVWTRVEQEIESIIEMAERPGLDLLVVSNEVGLGVVPPTRLGRIYRDLLGRANQRLALKAQEVFLVVSGLALEIKSRAYRPDRGADTLNYNQPLK